MKILLTLIVTLFCFVARAQQVTLNGTIQEKTFNSQQQVQEANYRGSGYWQKGPAVNAQLCVEIKDDTGRKVADTVIYTDTEGKFSAKLAAKKKYSLVIRYLCQDAPENTTTLTVGSKQVIDFKHLFKMRR